VALAVGADRWLHFGMLDFHTLAGEVWKDVEGVEIPFHTRTRLGVWGVVWKPMSVEVGCGN
jgi:hypothetical protein